MNTVSLTLGGAALTATASGALYWPAEEMLVVSDLHLGKAERMARRGGGLLPPYDTEETLARLTADLETWAPARVICLGDSFDDRAAAVALEARHRLTLAAMLAGRDWVWIAGNHDPGPVEIGGTHRAEVRQGALIFRHIAEPGTVEAEVSGHWHPKATVVGRGRGVRRACFLTDGQRLILPAYGAYTGGMPAEEAAAQVGMRAGAVAILAGRTMVRVPVACAEA